nr:hypothetical protein CFP56_25329 [Quercus suber]
MILDPEDSITLGADAVVDIASALAYIRAFMVDGEPLPTTNRVRPWREGRVAEYIGKALFLLELMNHWERWDDDALFLNMKREAIMGYHCVAIVEKRYLVTKEKSKDLASNNEDLKKISDVMTIVSKAEKLHAKVEENNKAIIERKDALEK